MMWHRCQIQKNSSTGSCCRASLRKGRGQLKAALLDVALLETLLDTVCDRRRDRSLEIINISTVDCLSEGSCDHVRAELERLVEDLSGTEILGVEGSDEDSVLAVRVELRVDGALVEGGHLEGVDGVLDDTAAALSVARCVEDAVLGHHLNL